MLDTKACIDAVFLDLRKAFDTVNYEIFLSKLTDFNFSLDAIQWMKPLFRTQEALAASNQYFQVSLSDYLRGHYLALCYSLCILVACQIHELMCNLKCMPITLSSSPVPKTTQEAFLLQL